MTRFTSNNQVKGAAFKGSFCASSIMYQQHPRPACISKPQNSAQLRGAAVAMAGPVSSKQYALFIDAILLHVLVYSLTLVREQQPADPYHWKDSLKLNSSTSASTTTTTSSTPVVTAPSTLQVTIHPVPQESNLLASSLVRVETPASPFAAQATPTAVMLASSSSSGATIPIENATMRKAVAGISPTRIQSTLLSSPVVSLKSLKGAAPEGTFGYRTVVAEFEHDNSLRQVVWRYDSSSTKASKLANPCKACALVQCY
jgi:hypothetical protein